MQRHLRMPVPVVTSMRDSWLLCILFLAMPVLANAASLHLRPVEVAPGILAPAGVMFAGLTISLRDLVHERAGWRVALACTLIGCAFSWAVSGAHLATASLCAFALSESADQVLFAASRRYGFATAVAASGVVGLALDSCVFLWLAPPLVTGLTNFALLPGQMVGKTWTLLTCVTVAVVHRGASALERW
jgi:uncharacterized PurR-regulated membrane protein YhhQ (DUF165 family)